MCAVHKELANISINQLVMFDFRYGTLVTVEYIGISYGLVVFRVDNRLCSGKCNWYFQYSMISNNLIKGRAMKIRENLGLSNIKGKK